MDEQRLQKWQELHRRHIHEEPMTDTEMALYQTGCDELDAEEMEVLNRTSSKQMQMLGQQIAEANVERQRLRDRETQQIARIAELEGRIGLFRFQIEEVIHINRHRPTLLVGRLLSSAIRLNSCIAVPLRNGSTVRGVAVDLRGQSQKKPLL